MSEKLKIISIRVPKELLNRASKVRATEGISVTFQIIKGLEMYLKTKEGK